MRVLYVLPTLKCNYKCSYCVGRSLPIVKHGMHRPVEDWTKLFNASDRPNIDLVCYTGREPTLYPYFTELVESINLPFSVDTNVSIPPSKWMSDKCKELCVSFNASLHFHPLHPKAQEVWDVLKWFSVELPNAKHQLTAVYSLREQPNEQILAKEMALKANPKTIFIPSTFCERFLFRDFVPHSGIATSCSAGVDTAAILPDGNVFRCMGHAYFIHVDGISAIGNILDEGWSILPTEANVCEHTVCTYCCDSCDIEWEK